MATHPPSTCKELLVAAIDFGTTFSGYAFSFKAQYNESPSKICARTWGSGSDLMSLKTPTVLLVRWDEETQTFNRVDFGYDAENRYQGLVDSDEQANYHLIRNFKMEMYSNTASSGLERDTSVSVCKGKSIKLMQAVSWAIEYLKENLLATLKDRMDIVGPDDIRWMLTVPAIWTDAGKQIMVEAATMAGILAEKLTLVLEPEAASMYCMNLQSNVSENEVKLREGTRFTMVDAGGGTVDITVHQINKGGGLLELHVPTGGPWGGTMVDRAFDQLLSEIFGYDVIGRFFEEYREDYNEIARSFEYKKRNVRKNNQWETLKVPASLLDVYRNVRQTTEVEVQESSTFKGPIKLVRDKLKLDAEVMQSLFQQSLTKISFFVGELLQECDNISTIVVVGGYAESLLLQMMFKYKYVDKQVVLPDESSLAVLKGAVMYGHDIGRIISRIAPYSYGIDTRLLFDPKRHPEANKIIAEGNDIRCRRCFHRHITKGEDLKWGDQHPEKVYYPVRSDQIKVLFPVYISTKEDPILVTDECCTYIGQMTVNLTDLTLDIQSRIVDVAFQFDGHITVTGVERATNKKVAVSIDFLARHNI